MRKKTISKELDSYYAQAVNNYFTGKTSREWSVGQVALLNSMRKKFGLRPNGCYPLQVLNDRADFKTVQMLGGTHGS